MTDIATLRRELLQRWLAAAATGRQPGPPALPRLGETEAPLSHAQERLWFVEQLGLSGSSYTVSAAVRLTGKLDVDALSAALSEVVRRHEILRTRFALRDESAVQVIDPPWPVVLSPDVVATEEVARQRLAAWMQQPFDLSQDRLLRVALLQLAPDMHVLALSMHHIVSDGWSMGVLVGEIETLYAALCAGRPSPLPELPIQYADYAVWQRRWLEETALQRQLEYWTAQLAGAPGSIELATDRPRPAVPSFRGAVHRFAVDQACTAALTRLARQDGATLFMVLLAAFDVLLSRWSGQHDVVVGTPVAGRTRIETERLIGFFVNMLALRCDFSGSSTFRDVLRQMKATALDAYAHQDLPFEKLVEALHPVRDLSREPIFQVVFALQNMPQRVNGLPGLTLEPFEAEAVTAKFDLELAMSEVDGGLQATLTYATDLFDAATIARLADHFVRLLHEIAARPDVRLSDLSLLSAAERQQLESWSGRHAAYAQDRCLHELFAEQAARDPAALAVVMEDEELSYGALERQANQLAHHLQGLGVGPDVIVGLCVERSLEMVVGVLGILKAGGAYLPFDPRYPAERLAYMLGDAKVTVLVTQAAVRERLPQTDAIVVQLEADAAEIAQQPDTAPLMSCDADHLAYVIYTSGSTGRPKGVMTSHRGIMNLADAQLAQLPLTAGDRILQFASISFDAAVWDLVMSWRVGAALVLAAQHDLMPGEPLRELLQRQRVTAVLLPPAALAALPRSPLPDLKILIAGGEACTAELLRPWLAGRAVFNAYGPTESSVCTTVHRCGEEGRPPIGRALPNTRTYVLDAQLEPVPVGVAGELYIGGAGLARGYLHRPSLTAERFVPSPFARGERLYRTGDLARWRGDGVLDYLGRLDHQVKLRGFRIELGEIEAALTAQAGVAQAAVVLREDGGSKRLVAYVVAQPDAVVDIDTLRRQLQQSLPDYMVPSAIVVLNSLPLTPNGKLDRNALPAPERRGDSDGQLPRNPVETVIAGLFADLLGLERVGIHDNFFELGGDSIQSMQLVSRARGAGIAITPRQIFQHQTVAALAQAAVASQASAEPDDPLQPSPLTPIQRWFVEGSGPIHHFNQSALLQVPPDIKPARLERALASLLIHHDALRSRFLRDESGWRQEPRPVADVAVTVTHVDVAELAPEIRIEQLHAAAATLQNSLDPSTGRLVAVAWFDFGADTPGRLLVVIHHLVVDGVSWRILVEDLMAAYEQLARGEAVNLPPKTTSFGRWATRLADHAHAPGIVQQLDLWTSICRDAPALPVDRATGTRLATYGDTFSLTIDLPADDTQALLTVVPKAYHSRINDALLAALAIALADWRAARGGNETVSLVDLEGHGRESIFPTIDLSRTVGWFTTMFPVRLDVSQIDLTEAIHGGPAAGVVLRRIKDHLRDVPDGGIGWGLLRYLNQDTAKILQDVPRASISFNYLGRFDERGAAGWGAASEDTGPAIAAEREREHLIEAVSVIRGGKLLVEWRWWPEAHDRASIADLADRFSAALKGLIAHCRACERSRFTRSDFPLVALDESRLASLQQRYPDLEDVWPLGPMQQIMLTHARRAPDSIAYHEQLQLTLDGELDAGALATAWRGLIARHGALRVAFPDDGERPVQIVRRTPDPRWRFIDGAELLQDDDDAQLEALLLQDRKAGFDLAGGDVLRASLLRQSRTRHTLVLSFHHILLDGWSVPLVLRELLELYQAARLMRPASLPAPSSYRDFLSWQGAANAGLSREFWTSRLRGAALPDRLDLISGNAQVSADAAGEVQARILERLTAKIQTAAQALRLTTNTLVQGAWSLALARHANTGGDVVFGMTTAVRPADVAGVEQIVGLCTNTLPRRVSLAPEMRLSDWLADLQARQADEQMHDRCRMSDICGWLDLPGDQRLFESVVVFENYPTGHALTPGEATAPDDINVVSFESVEAGIDFPLCLVASVDSCMSFRLIFGRRRFDADAVARLLDDVVELMLAITADPERRLADLWPGQRPSAATPRAPFTGTVTDAAYADAR
ncbi:non-ribosomal peptide synthetase [Bradyrhizobium sp. SRS-191]|uniref:non-ribosomal peptide synthetase n=1 Tax=Bradyrhizobium sp. SRS-191 TaxID=2962606 RepID=UPI00211F03BF|nr:non-ribosomal peptide synthetase [Bradyrhizobium sp. SRS-191]